VQAVQVERNGVDVGVRVAFSFGGLPGAQSALRLALQFRQALETVAHSGCPSP